MCPLFSILQCSSPSFSERLIYRDRPADNNVEESQAGNPGRVRSRITSLLKRFGIKRLEADPPVQTQSLVTPPTTPGPKAVFPPYTSGKAENQDGHRERTALKELEMAKMLANLNKGAKVDRLERNRLQNERMALKKLEIDEMVRRDIEKSQPFQGQSATDFGIAVGYYLSLYFQEGMNKGTNGGEAQYRQEQFKTYLRFLHTYQGVENVRSFEDIRRVESGEIVSIKIMTCLLINIILKICTKTEGRELLDLTETDIEKLIQIKKEFSTMELSDILELKMKNGEEFGIPAGIQRKFRIFLWSYQQVMI